MNMQLSSFFDQWLLEPELPTGYFKHPKIMVFLKFLIMYNLHHTVASNNDVPSSTFDSIQALCNA